MDFHGEACKYFHNKIKYAIADFHCRDIAKDENSFEPNLNARTRLPDSSPVVSLDWGTNADEVYIASRQFLYALNTSQGQDETVTEEAENPNPLIITSDPLKAVAIYKCVFGNIMDISFVPKAAKTSERICMACDDGKLRVMDLGTQKIISQHQDHNGVVEVCQAK